MSRRFTVRTLIAALTIAAMAPATASACAMYIPEEQNNEALVALMEKIDSASVEVIAEVAPSIDTALTNVQTARAEVEAALQVQAKALLEALPEAKQANQVVAVEPQS